MKRILCNLLVAATASLTVQALGQVDLARLDSAVWKVEWADGTPVANQIVVREVFSRQFNPGDSATTSQDGTVHFSSKAPRRPDDPIQAVRIVLVSPSAITYAQVDPSQPGRVIRLKPTAPLKFKLVDQKGQPLSGVKVFANRLSQGEEGLGCWVGSPKGGPSEDSDSNGICTFPGLPVGDSLRIEHRDPRFVAIPWETTLEVGKDGQTVTLGPGATIAGKVLDADGRPVSKSWVSASGPKGDGPRGVQSDAQGAYLMTGVAPGNYQIHFSPPQGRESELAGHTRENVFVKSGDRLTGVDVSFVKVGYLVGTVTYANTGHPAANVGVSTRSVRGSDFPSGTTDSDGNYRIAVPAGAYFMGAVPPGVHVVDMNYNKQFEVRVGQTVRASLSLPVEPFSAPLHGRVVDGKGDPVGGATVFTAGDLKPITATTGQDGSFAFAEKVSAPAQVRAFKGADCTASVELVTRDAPITLTLSPNSMSTLEGRVIDDTGSTLPGVHVMIFDLGGHSQPLYDGHTGSDGSYRFERAWPNSRYVIFADMKGYEGGSIQSVEVGSGEHKSLENIKLLANDTFVAGRVVDDNGDPVEGANVTLQIPQIETATAKDGTFRLEGASRRQYDVVAKKGDRNTVKAINGGTSDALLVLKAPPRIITQPPPQVDQVAGIVGMKAPSLRIRQWVNTKPIDLQAVKAKAVVLNFWGGTCPACVVELPDVQEYADQIANEGMLLVGIHDSVSTPTQVKKFLTDHKVRFAVAMDVKDPAGFGKTFQAFKVAASPAFVVIRNGKVVCATHSLEEMMAFVNKIK